MHLLFAALLLRHWLLASDLHVDPRLSPRTAMVADGQDTNWALFDSTVAAMRKAEPDPPVVILSGDFLAHRFPRDAALAEKTMARIARTFDAAFPRAQFVIVPGNNDDPCGDYRDTPGTPYFMRIAQLWAPLVNRGGAAPEFQTSFGRYGWYGATLPGRLRAFALDSVYWSILYRSCRSSNAGAPQRELQWLAASLRGLSPKNRALLVMHIPPGVDPRVTLMAHRLLIVPFWQDRYTSAFMRDVAPYAKRIPFAIAGHEHRDGFRLFAGVPIVIAPPISPVYDNTPTFLRLDVTPDGTLADYTPFQYDPFSQQWQRDASFDTTYNANGFSAASVAAIHARLSTDPYLRTRWGNTLVASNDNHDVTPATWRTYWCAQTELASSYAACAGLQRRITLVPIALGVACAAVLALLGFLAMRLGRQRRRT